MTEKYLAGYHPLSQGYYQSSSIASALAPMPSQAQEPRSRPPLLPQTRTDYPSSGYSQDNNNWHVENRIHAQTIPRSVSVMPERQMHQWNPNSGLRSDSESKYFPPEKGPRRSATPGPQNMHQPSHTRQPPVILPPVPRIPTAYYAILKLLQLRGSLFSLEKYCQGLTVTSYTWVRVPTIKILILLSTALIRGAKRRLHDQMTWPVISQQRRLTGRSQDLKLILRESAACAEKNSLARMLAIDMRSSVHVERSVAQHG
ncbi:hypothetical protein H0H92_010235 [Tricholoma furcatifolium]|nr:hypothetical protein H0H92_010235 [Tricholoma furcatifolium]